MVQELHEQGDYSIIVVNDGSGPEYQHIFDALPDYCTLLVHDVNCGKGRAMKTGFAYLLEHAPDSPGVVIVDADGQHLTEDVNRVVADFLANPDALVIGSRKFTGKVPFRSRFGNGLTKHVFALASGVKIQDTQTGLRALPLSSLSDFLSIKGERYEYEMNMLLRAAEMGLKIREVFIETVYINENSSSHFHVIRDSLRIYAVLLKFAAASLISFLVDFVLLYVFQALAAPVADENLRLLISVVGARAISSLVNFFLNKKVVFKNNHGVLGTIVKYYVLVGVVLAANYGLMALLHNFLGLRLFWSKIITEVTLFAFSYVMQRMVVFRNKPISTPDAP